MPHDLRTKTLRNQTKAYDMEDQLKAEYSITLLGKKYPLLTKTMKGFTSKASKSGKTRFNKLFNAPSSIKQEYIQSVNNALNMHDSTAQASVGDDTKNQFHASKGNQKQEKDITFKSDLSYDKAPESVEVFNEEKKQLKKEEEPQLQTTQEERQQANVIEKRGEQQQQQQQALLNIGEAVSKPIDLTEEEEQYIPGPAMKIKKSQRREDLDAKRYLDKDGNPLQGKAKERRQAKYTKTTARNKMYSEPEFKGYKGKNGRVIKYRVEKETGNIVAMVNPKNWPDEAKEALKTHKHTKAKQGAPKKGGARKKKMRGGMLEGDSHEQGGIPIEAEGGEFVMNKESTKHFEPQLKKMNDAGNQLRDASNPQLRSRKMGNINKIKRRMRKGGMLKYRNGGKIYANGGMVSEIEQPSAGGGLVGQLSRDDGTADKGLYQELINKYFTKMDFTQTLKYVKNKNRDVETLGEDELRSKAQSIAQQAKVQLKYNGNSLSLLKNQVYELMAIRLAMQQQSNKSSQKGNVGLVVDMESVFGEGAEIDKDAFAQRYGTMRRGGKIMAKGGKIDAEKVAADMEQPEDLQNIVAQGKEGEMTQPKPEQKKAFQDFQNLSAGGQSEGAISRGESSYTRRTFNLPMALNGSVEMGWRQRYAQDIDQHDEEFKKSSIFKYRKKSNKKGRRNLLS